MKLILNYKVEFRSSGNKYLTDVTFSDEDSYSLFKEYKEGQDSDKEIELIKEVIKAYCEAEYEPTRFINGISVTEREFKDKIKKNGSCLNIKTEFELETPEARCVWILLAKYGYTK